MYLVSATINKVLSTVSHETLHQAQEHLGDLELSVSKSMVYLRDPSESWIGTHLHWLDHIAHVRASIYYQNSAGLVHIFRNDGRALLQAYMRLLSGQL